MIITKKSLLNIIMFSLIFILSFCFRTPLFGIIMILTTLIYGIKIIFKQNFTIKIIIIFILLYNMTFLYYFIAGIQISYYTQFNQFEYIYTVALLCYVFSITFFWQLNKIKSKEIYIQLKDNSLLYIVFICIFIVMFLRGIDGKIGDYRAIELSTATEYSVLFFLLAFLFTGEKKIRKHILCIICGCFAIYAIMIGSRIVGIQFLMAIFLLNDFVIIKNIKYSSNNIKQNLYIIYILLGVLVMKGFGAIRSNGFSINKLVEAMFSTSVVDNMIMNNQSDVIYSTMSLIAMKDLKIINLEVIIKSFFAHINGIFLPSSINGIYGNFPKFVVENSLNYGGGGGFFFGPIYIWFGIVGVGVFSILLGRIIKNAYDNKPSDIVKFYILILLVTFFRWYPYTIYGIYKLPLYGLIIYLLANMLHNTMKRR